MPSQKKEELISSNCYVLDDVDVDVDVVVDDDDNDDDEVMMMMMMMRMLLFRFLGFLAEQYHQYQWMSNILMYLD